MMMEMESWECVEECTPRSESEDSCVIVTYADSICSSGRPESKGSARGPYHTMAERVELCKQRRQELQMRYEEARKQKEEEKREKEELKSNLDKLQRKALLEQKRVALRMQKQMEREAQQRQELLRQQQELACLHNFRRILLHYGLVPWCRFLLRHRRSMKSASTSYERRLMKRALKCLYVRCLEGRSLPKQRARNLASRAKHFRARWTLRYCWQLWLEGRQGEQLYRQGLLKRSCKALKEALHYYRSLGRMGDERNRFRLLFWTWSKWWQFFMEAKSSQFLKYLETDQIASHHCRRFLRESPSVWICLVMDRATYVRILRAWKDGLGIIRYEKQQMQHKAEAWTKIHLWLDEHQQVMHV